MRHTGGAGGKILPRSCYARPTVAVALDLLGKILLHRSPEGIAAGKIVEVEAYFHGDPSSHSTYRKNESTAVIWGKPGVAYVYLNYGMYHCLNVVTEPSGTAGCVLIRALEPTAGIPLMELRRNTTDLYNLARGPGKLTRALAITAEDNGADFTRGPLVMRDNEEDFEIVVATRIGLSRAVHEPLRFFIKDNRCVSFPHKGKRFLEGTVEEVKEAFLRGMLKTG